MLLEALARQEAVVTRGQEKKDDDATLADLPLEEGEVAVSSAFTRENRTMERFGEKLRAAVAQMENGVSNRAFEKYMNLLYGQTETILDYMVRPIVVMDEPEALFARMDSRSGEFDQAFSAALERGEALPEQRNLMLTQEQMLDAVSETTLLAMTTILRPVAKLKPTLLAQMGGMGAEIFDLSWIESAVHLFFLFGWVLFGVGVIVAAFDLAVEYQNGRATIKSTMLNILKGFFAANLVTVVPVHLYTFCISLQNVFLKDLAADFVGAQNFNLGEVALKVLAAKFGPPTVGAAFGLLNLFTLIALAYCVLKVFFANIKRGGILLIQMAVGSLYLFSVPRGYTDGFSQWCKQIFALCLTAFLQTVLLFLGLLTFQDNLLLGLGIMLAAGEVPRIAQQFGLDSSVKVNMMSVVHATSTAVNMTRNIAKAL